MNARPLRILVTGSRNWTHVPTIRHTLRQIAADNPNRDITLVHGAARGVDRLAAHIADSELRWTLEPHPADWDNCDPVTCPPGHRQPGHNGRDYCPSAGHRRNSHMVSLGADLCIAFWLNRSPGTASCIDKAEQAGIPVRKITGYHQEPTDA
jgi:hypothetical protein